MPAVKTSSQARAGAKATPKGASKKQTTRKSTSANNKPKTDTTKKGQQQQAEREAAAARKTEREAARKAQLDAIDVTKLVTAYVKKHATDDTLAPMHGLPFVQNDRVYLQVEGRATEGLLGFARSSKKSLNELPKGVLLEAVRAAGFTRSPFSYQHPEKQQTSASYFSAPVEGFDLGSVKTRKVAERGGQSPANVERRMAAVQAAEKAGSIPMRPSGSDDDKAKLADLERTMSQARDAWKQACLDGADKDEQSKREAAYHSAKDEWTEFRQTMHSKSGKKS